jgi:hypothetical protein
MDMDKRTVVIGLVPSDDMHRWRATFKPAYIRNVDSLVEKMRAKADALSSYLSERMDTATKEFVNS